MSMTSPLSLGEVRRLAGNADTILLRATRAADLETPVGAFLRLDDGGPAYLLESVEGGERVCRYSFLGVGPRRTLEVRGGTATIVERPLSVDAFRAGLPSETLACGLSLPSGPSCPPHGRAARACRASPAAPWAPWPTTPSASSSLCRCPTRITSACRRPPSWRPTSSSSSTT
jgi:hypothetical protein